MSKYLKISLVFILVLLTGCGTVTKGNNIVKTKTESTEQQWANEVTATIDAAGNVTVISENSQTDSATDAGDEHNKGTNSSALDSNQTSNDGANTDAGNKDNSPNNKPADNDNQMINVSISIDCKTILNNMDKISDGYKFNINIPSSGIILPNTVYKVKKNTTVLELLRQINGEKELKLVANSGYVSSIKDIPQFCVGEKSGWIYSVNGKYVNVGAGGKKLKDGDAVKWMFTCDYGKDLSWS